MGNDASGNGYYSEFGENINGSHGGGVSGQGIDWNRREQVLNNIVHSANANLIDISAVEQPDTRQVVSQRTVKEFRRAFSGRKSFSGGVSGGGIGCIPLTIDGENGLIDSSDEDIISNENGTHRNNPISAMKELNTKSSHKGNHKKNGSAEVSFGKLPTAIPLSSTQGHEHLNSNKSLCGSIDSLDSTIRASRIHGGMKNKLPQTTENLETQNMLGMESTTFNSLVTEKPPLPFGDWEVIQAPISDGDVLWVLQTSENAFQAYEKDCKVGEVGELVLTFA